PPFSLEGSAALPTVHAFPTRRSSDLDRHGGVALRGRHARAVPPHARRAQQCGGLPPGISPPHPRRPGGVAVEICLVADPHIVALDRKSTRLNSSHRTISYAVFCLKKK